MWVFLVTEVMFFGGLFTGMRSTVPPIQRHSLRAAIISISCLEVNTAVLIGRSDHGAGGAQRAGRWRSGLVRCLLLTILLGLVFLGIKGVEYAHKFEEHLVPGRWFVSKDRMPQVQLFRLLLSMTGMHALHMIIGISFRCARLASLARPLSPAY
jgi:cytochrome c oxidase subunit 3